MRLEFPDSVPVRGMVEIGKIYWNYPSAMRASLSIYRDDVISVINLHSYLTAMQRDPDSRINTKGMSLECDNDEVGMYLMLKYF